MSKFLSKLKEISLAHSHSANGTGDKPSTKPEFQSDQTLGSHEKRSANTPEQENQSIDFKQPLSSSVNEEIHTNQTPLEDSLPPVADTPQPPTAKRFSAKLATIKPALGMLKTKLLKKPSPPSRKFWIGLGAVGVGGGLMAIGVGLRSVERNLPETSDVLTFVRDGTVTIKAADDTILQQTGPATREKLKIDKIPPKLIEAFVASEDRRFYQHKGIDYQGIFRALFSNLIARDVVQGGSTITQQLARIVFLTQDPSAERKLKEAMLARRIEKELTKEQILERYVNLVYLGSGAYGVADAAWVYFGKPVEELNLQEMATIAGLPPAPTEYSPLVNRKLARQRRNVVLQEMQEAGFITAQEAETAKKTPLELNPKIPKRLWLTAPYFTSYIQKELPKYVSKEELEMGGLTVETSLNLKWQKIAEKVVKEAVEYDGASQGFEQAALVAIDPRNGEVQALVGGAQYQESEFNRVTQAQRQPGSTFKAFVYTAAIAAGFSPYDSYQDAPMSIDGYKPENYGNSYSGGWLSMMNALAKSTNVIAVRVLADVGFDPTIKMARAMGIKTELKPYYAMALGAIEVNLLELTNGFGTLAAEGKYAEAHGIRRVLNRKGEVIYEFKTKPKQVLDKGSASIMTWMLEGVVQGGTGGAASLGDRQVAGKTGTSEQARDLWFIGYIPQLVTGVWLGNDDSYPTWGTSSTAAFTWHEFMKRIVNEIPVQEFPKLPDLYDRKGSIKAKPVEASIQYYEIQKPPATQSNNQGYSDPGYSNQGYYDPGYSNQGYSDQGGGQY